MHNMEPRKIAAIIIGILVAALAFFLISSFWSWATSSNDPEPTTTEQVSLAASSDTALVTRITTSGEIINNEDYNSVRISVSRSDRTLEIMSGYQNIVTEVVKFDNNQPAYESFLLAIELEGFRESQEGVNTDERGYCAADSRTVYEAIGNIAVDQRLWSGSCSKKLGTFAGDVRGVEKLFEAQIPNYSTLVRGLNI